MTLNTISEEQKWNIEYFCEKKLKYKVFYEEH